MVEIEGTPPTGLAKLIGHDVKINLAPMLGVHDYMPEIRLLGFDAVSIEVQSNYTTVDFIPMMRVVGISHATYCRDDQGNTCKVFDN